MLKIVTAWTLLNQVFSSETNIPPSIMMGWQQDNNKLYNIHRENAKHLKKVLDDYCGDPDKRDYFDFNIHPSSIKVYEGFVLGVYLFSSSDDDY